MRERLGPGRVGAQAPASTSGVWLVSDGGDSVNWAHSLPPKQALPFPSAVD